MKGLNIFNEIGKDKKVMGYVIKILLFLMLSSVIAFRDVLDFFKDFDDWENVFVGICTIIFLLWCFIESFIGMIKIVAIIEKKEKEQKDN